MGMRYFITEESSRVTNGDIAFTHVKVIKAERAIASEALVAENSGLT